MTPSKAQPGPDEGPGTPGRVGTDTRAGADRPNPRIVLTYLSSTAKAGWQRVRGAVVPNTQAAVFATFSWLICHQLLGAPNPIFAPVATFLCLGFSRNREPRRVLEVGLGATIGVFIGEVLTHAVGFGWWQLLLLLLTTPLLARFLANSDLLTFQTAINAVVVGSMIQLATSSGIDPRAASFGRWTDALIGSGIALVASIILPSSLTSRPRRYTATALGGIADALDAVGHGLEQGEVNRGKAAYAALAVARTQLTDGEAAQRSASDMVQLKPSRRAERADLAELDRMLRLGDRLHGSVFMLTRQAAGMIGESGAYPEVAELTAEAGRTLRSLARQVGRWEKPEGARAQAMALAARLEPDALGESADWRSNALVSLLRSVIVDLLQITGLSVPQARSALPDTGDLDVRSDDAETLPSEESSDLWGTLTFPAIPAEPDPQPRTGPAPAPEPEPDRRRPAGSEQQDGPRPEDGHRPGGIS
ncbi:Uncharacterized membrane protein YgaE, UPF0421/DUF939 family [Raineyella antarctica]|uniref:Uncharacterized membrane protein YgaE, UPF0421/DUF939 family n=1 Tax=Raineyella antarctica TaxID=1577474 RepID=A0A1G6HGP0_9ACTN|nr:FUSC family protein [Raineyella antarctica]SDB92616.1 Uncharacterized membrane protein YgaE, UPF0421/DUF939 family [Raineyella antarctica]